MNYEKAYKEALERAREFQKSKDGLCVLTAESIFPELRDSKDERIRKALVRFHKSTIDVDGIKGEDIIAWLEKQGEKKATWGEDDEKIITALMQGLRYHQLFNPTFGEVPNAEIIAWFKSLKERLL